MTTPKSLPERPSLQSLRKQAKRLQREIAVEHPDATARARAQLPLATLPLTLRDAQLVVAREYGFAGWQDLTTEVLARTGQAIVWAAGRARRAIHEDDLEALQRALAGHPALLSYRDASGATLLSFAAEAFGQAGDASREQVFTRRACAELLLDRGAPVDSEVWQNILMMRSKGMLQLLASKTSAPRELRVLAALGDLEAVRGLAGAAPRAELHDACTVAGGFGRVDVAAWLLERCIQLDPELGSRVDDGLGRGAFLAYFAEHDGFGAHDDLWQSYVDGQLQSAIDANDARAFAQTLQRESWVLGEASVERQVELIEHATYTGRDAFIRHLLAAQPALSARRPTPPSAAIEYAFEYGHANFVPLLSSVWAVPDDLPHAAGSGDLDRVKRWFDADGRLALGELGRHYPLDNPRKLGHLHWSAGEAQHVLDSALAWACLNHRFEIAELLLERGADIDTDWATHEPASILHECAIQANYTAAQFLIDHGIDMTLRDYRWNSNAEGWARFGAGDEAMAEFLAAAERERG